MEYVICNMEYGICMLEIRLIKRIGLTMILRSAVVNMRIGMSPNTNNIYKQSFFASLAFFNSSINVRQTYSLTDSWRDNVSLRMR